MGVERLEHAVPNVTREQEAGVCLVRDAVANATVIVKLRLILGDAFS
jgi:hypothetical protein